MMNKKVYGVIGISAVMANWNADFSGFPKTTSDGMTYGSDKALKYPIKKMWENEGKNVIYIKSMKLEKDKKGETVLAPRSLKERYEYIFKNSPLSESKDSSDILKNLFSATDIKNFGATFAEEGNNIAITGAVQIGQGFNKYDDTEPQEQQILSPFRDSKSAEKSKNNEEAKSSTLGTKIVSNESHYFYPLVINPLAYKEWEDLDVTEGYSENDYLEFKRAATTAVTAFATNSKMGCENEFALFIETEIDAYLPNLDKYISFNKGEEKNTIEINCGDVTNPSSARIINIELYYDSSTTEIKTNMENVKYIDIMTQKEV